ncbi:MAG: hypothetical protein IIC67_09630 [Thaumarchaeota archaeon]|nr:hypothetical protein [Nitrososphaerota archaeon]
MDHLDFAADLELDPNQLDVEAVRQGEIFYKWAEQLVNAKEHVDRMKFQLEVTEAKLNVEIRDDPAKFRIEKITEAVVKAAIVMSPRYEEKRCLYIEAQSVSALLSNAVAALEQKKRMLEVLITLHGQEYFAGPSTPRNLVQACVDAKEKRIKEGEDKQAKRSRRRKKTRGNV